MSNIINNNWYNLNSTRNYPLDDGATTIDDSGKQLPNTLIADLNLRMPKSVGEGAMISSVVVSSTLVSVTFLAINHPINPSVYDPAPSLPEFSPLCAVTLPKPVIPGKVYSITPLVDGVFGWIVFGDGVARTWNGRFSTPQQSAIMPKVCRGYNDTSVDRVSKKDSANNIGGIVNLIEGNDIAIYRDVKYIDDRYREVVVISLKENNTVNVYDKYRGPCSGRPESGTCAKEGIEFINGIAPDCDGNIQISFEEPFRIAYCPEETPGCMAVDYPVGLSDACTKQDRLPDADGNPPDRRDDQCGSSYGDPDANAYPDGSPTGPPIANVSSSTLTPISLPVALNFDEGLNHFWQNIKGDFEFGQNDYFTGGSSSASLSVPTDNAYFSTGIGGRNITLWYNSGYSSLIGKRIYAELLLERSNGFYPNGGLIVNYRANALATLDEFFVVHITRKTSSLEILRFNGYGYIKLASSDGLGIAVDKWYKVQAEIEAGVTPGTVVITAKVYDAESYSLIATTTAQTSLYYPDTGKAGLTADKCRTRFRSFNMEVM